jgi:ribose transport system substrate-binding protein
MTRNKGLRVAMATLIAVAAIGAGSAATLAQADPDCAAEYISTAPLIHPYLQNQQKGFEEEAAAHGRSFQWLTSQEFDEARQLELTETALGSDCLKGIAIITATPSLFKGVIEESESRGFATVQQVCSPDQFAAVCLEIDNPAAMAMIADAVAERLEGAGNVVVSIGDTGPSHTIKRDALIDHWAMNYPDIAVVGVVQDCDTADTTVACAENALATYPEMNAYVSTGNQNAVGAAQVFPAAGRGDIVIAGLDDDPVVIDGIRQGTVALTLQQNPIGQGRLFFLIPFWMAEEGLKPIETLTFVDTPGFIVDSSNVDDFEAAQAADTDGYIAFVKETYFTE